jgi:adenylate cyclase
MPPELVYELDGKRQSYALEKDEATIGRSADNDVVIRDVLVSRHHARIYRVRGAWRVADLGSSNGTRVNGVDPTHRDLRSGDRIQLHKFCLTFLDGDAPGVSLMPDAPDATTGSLGGGTVIRSAVDFSALASMHGESVGLAPRGASRLEKLLDIVTKASEALLASTSLDDTLSTVLDLIFEHLAVDRGCIMLWNEQNAELEVRCVKHKGGGGEEIRFSRTIAEKVYREKVSILTSDAMSDDRFAGGQSIVALNIRSAMAAPLWSGDRVEGLIYADTPARVKAFDNFDLDVLSALGNHAAVAIEHARLQTSILEQQLVRRRLERYHSPAVIERITQLGDGASSLAADELEVTVMFADVVDFTRRCEAMEPKQVAQLLNRYFSEMAEVVFRHDGTLDKFIGDCMMAVFGAPLPAADHARRGVDAALDMREALTALNEPLAPESRLQFRIGMHSGRVVAGDIGSVRRSDYTVLGSTVNLAARLESALAAAGQIVISDATRDALGDDYETRRIGEFRPKGFSRDVGCYEVLGRRG